MIGLGLWLNIILFRIIAFICKIFHKKFIFTIIYIYIKVLNNKI